MDYVALIRLRSSVTSADRDAALVRRAGWQYPTGIRPIAEYWPAASDLQVVSIFAADEYGPVMELVLEWNDVFDIDVYPAVSADDGIALGGDVYARLPRMQQAQP